MKKEITLNNIDYTILKMLKPKGYKLADVDMIKLEIYVNKDCLVTLIKKRECAFNNLSLGGNS